MHVVHTDNEVRILPLLSRDGPLFDAAVAVTTAALSEHDPFGPVAVCGGNLDLFPLLTAASVSACSKSGTVFLIQRNGEVQGVAGMLGPGQSMSMAAEPTFITYLEKLSEEGKEWSAKTHSPIKSEMTRKLPFSPEDPDRYTIEFFAINPANERQGLGRRLLHHCLEIVRNEVRAEAARLWLTSSPNAVPFYKSCGLEEVHRVTIPSPWGTWEETLFLWQRA